MLPELVDIKLLKGRAKKILKTAYVPPKIFTAMYLLLLTFLKLIAAIADKQKSFMILFLEVLITLLFIIFDTGFIFYCITVYRGKKAKYSVLFDGFRMSGKIILFMVIKTLVIVFYYCFFIIPGIIAHYRYRFALYNFLENPDIGILNALHLSRIQTEGYKMQLFQIDLSYVGWVFLSNIPALVYYGVIYGEINAQFPNMQVMPTQAEISNFLDSISIFGISSVVWHIGALFWIVLIGIFYLPNIQCVLLDLFDVAKRTSGLDVQKLDMYEYDDNDD